MLEFISPFNYQIFTLLDNHFIPFETAIPDDWMPKKFPSPFLERPHALCKVAVSELQKYLQNPIDWTYDFGLNQPEGSLRIGKMFGVLVVQNLKKELGYLAAFSGKLANKNHHQKFVPPVFDSLTKNSFLNVGMEVLNGINQEIKRLEKSPNWLAANQVLQDKKAQAKKEMVELKLSMKQRKAKRDIQRRIAKKECSIDQLKSLNSRLDKESVRDRKAIKKLNKQWKLQLEKYKADLMGVSQEIQRLKEQRKKKSNGLQQQLFESYRFLNNAGESKSLSAIFQDTKPVSGAGECAAPKLLQYAFLNQLKPIALAEFWWGKPPKSAIRQHGLFYPPCDEKCRPILGHMLAGVL